MHKKIKWANLPIAAFLVLFALICVLPFWLVLSGSLTGESEIMAYGYGLFPRKVDFTDLIEFFEKVVYYGGIMIQERRS